MKTAKATVVSLVQSFFRYRDRGKASYAKSDQILEELITSIPPGVRVALPDGRKVELVDNFAFKNKVFKPCGISRFDLKITDA